MSTTEEMNTSEVEKEEVTNETCEGGNDPSSEETETIEIASDVEVEDASETSEDEEETSDSGEEGEVKKKKGLFSKKDKTDKKDEQIKDLTERNLRLMAEFDNFRKRTEKEKSQMFEIGAKSILEKLLPIVDNFERGLATVSEEEKETGFANGMDLIYKQLMKMLEDLDVVAIPAVGENFDPNLHNAVMHIEDENYGENVIVQEFQRGYTYRGNVIRHSMVQVAN